MVAYLLRQFLWAGGDRSLAVFVLGSLKYYMRLFQLPTTTRETGAFCLVCGLSDASLGVLLPAYCDPRL